MCRVSPVCVTASVKSSAGSLRNPILLLGALLLQPAFADLSRVDVSRRPSSQREADHDDSHDENRNPDSHMDITTFVRVPAAFT